MIAIFACITMVIAAGQPTPPQDQKEQPAKPLKVGDPAPALKATKWLQGQEVTKFEAGKVYVVEFWATWCGPCIIMMPHLAELQAQYKDQGVTLIGFSAVDQDNTEDKATAFVKKRGAKLKYTFAFADDRTTYDAWMEAAGRKGIPCTFVVDKTGRIAYIGHPMYLGVVLPKVVAGKTKAEAIGAEMAKVEEEANAVYGSIPSVDPKADLKALNDFEAKYPPLTNNPIHLRVKFTLLPKVGAVDETRKLAEAVMARAVERDDPSALAQVSGLLRLGPGKDSKELMAVAVKVAEARVRLVGDKDASALIDLASTYFVAGDKAKAREYARKALGAAAGESPALQAHIEQELRKFEEEK